MTRLRQTTHHYGADMRCTDCGLGFRYRDEQCEPTDGERRDARIRYAQECERSSTRRAELTRDFLARLRSLRGA